MAIIASLISKHVIAKYVKVRGELKQKLKRQREREREIKSKEWLLLWSLDNS